MNTCELMSPFKPQLFVPKDAAWMIPLFLVSARSRWSSVVGTLIWAWFQPSISPGYQMIPKVLAWPFKPQKVTPKAIFWSTIMVFNLGSLARQHHESVGLLKSTPRIRMSSLQGLFRT